LRHRTIRGDDIDGNTFTIDVQLKRILLGHES
jgi:hypothetical protein